MTVLEDYIASYPGVLLLVSHDRAFVDSLVDKLFILAADGSGSIKVRTAHCNPAMSHVKALRNKIGCIDRRALGSQLLLSKTHLSDVFSTLRSTAPLSDLAKQPRLDLQRLPRMA
jgi:hypothetical protein